MRSIRIGTRGSALALCQTELVADAIRKADSSVTIEIVTIKTRGDRILDVPLADFGGKGAFVTEFEQALLEGSIDLAVHSAKDMPTELAGGLDIVAVLKREDARDVLLTRKGERLSGEGMGRPEKPESPEEPERPGLPERPEELEKSGQLEKPGKQEKPEKPEDRELCIGTSSLRRQEQIRRLLPASCRTLRGNVTTRIEKLKDGMYDGIVLAAAGLKRLSLTEDEMLDYRYLSYDEMIPAGGQGIIAVEGRSTDQELKELLVAVNDAKTAQELEIERYILRRLGAGCHEPVGVFSRLEGGHVRIWLFTAAGGYFAGSREGSADDWKRVAQELIEGKDDSYGW